MEYYPWGNDYYGRSLPDSPLDRLAKQQESRMQEAFKQIEELRGMLSREKPAGDEVPAQSNQEPVSKISFIPVNSISMVQNYTLPPESMMDGRKFWFINTQAEEFYLKYYDTTSSIPGWVVKVFRGSDPDSVPVQPVQETPIDSLTLTVDNEMKELFIQLVNNIEHVKNQLDKLLESESTDKAVEDEFNEAIKSDPKPIRRNGKFVKKEENNGVLP